MSMSRTAQALLFEAKLADGGWKLNFVHGDVVDQIDLDRVGGAGRRVRDADEATERAVQWLTEDGVRYVDCSFCGAGLGDPCRSRRKNGNGLRKNESHASRAHAIKFSEAQRPLRDAFFKAQRLVAPKVVEGGVRQ